MFTRRRVLQIAAASSAAASVAVASDLTPAQAARALAQPLTAQPVAPNADPRTDPVAFADKLARHYTNDFFSGNEQIASATRYYRARALLQSMYPELEHVGHDHPFTIMDEAAHDMWSESSAEGIRQGAAMESLRRAVIGPLTLCLPCQGSGFKGQTLDVCPKCNGQGAIPHAMKKR